MTLAQTLDFVLKPVDAGERPLTFWLAIAVDHQIVWPVRGEASIGLEIQIDDLLAYLTEFWKPLMLRQVYPVPVAPLRPSDLRRFAEQRWSGMQSVSVEKEEALVSAFEEAHDLSLAFGGQYGLPHFWMMRAADFMTIEVAARLWQIPFETIRKSLSDTGDRLCSFLIEIDEERWAATIKAWQRRDNADGVGLLAWSAGIEKSLARSLISNGFLRAPRDFDDAANDDDELRIAARMAGALPSDQIRTILKIARSFKHREADRLKFLSEKCLAYTSTSFSRKPAFAQGEAVALFARERLDVANDGRADIAKIVLDLGIEVRTESTEPSTFDGLAIWGSAFGPGVFLNQSSDRIDAGHIGPFIDNKSIRVTLAHELCHLLMDGGHALSAVEVLNARMPTGIEARAKSFAGEFLLPTQTAARAWERARRPTDHDSIKNLLSELSDGFGVTWSVAAWKLQHGAAIHNADLEQILDVVAPYR